MEQISSVFVEKVNSFLCIFSERFNTVLVNIINTFLGFVVSFIAGWQLALFALLITVPLFMLFYFATGFSEKAKNEEISSISKASAKTKECFTSIKTVKAMNGEEYEIKNHELNLKESKKNGIKNGLYLSIIWAFIVTYYALTNGLLSLISEHIISNRWINSNWNKLYITRHSVVILNGTSIGL